MSIMNKNHKAFTIVELLVVIVVIGILATITVNSYTGISKKAMAAAMQADLANNTRLLQLYQVEYGSYPLQLNDDNCPTSPTFDSRYCLDSSADSTVGYSGTPTTYELAVISPTESYVTNQTGNISTASIPFVVAWGGSGAEEIMTAIRTSDNGFIATGYTSSFGAGSYDATLIKFNDDGSIQWKKTWGGTGSEVTYNLAQLSDGGYVTEGYTTSYGAGGYDQLVNKYSSTGALEWSRTWGGASTDLSYGMVVTSDGSIVTAGWTGSYGAGSSDILVTKYSADGTFQWSKTWGGTGVDSGNAIAATSDGGFIVVGHTVSFGAGAEDTLLLKYNSAGDVEWSKTWGGTGYDILRGVSQVSDGGYIVAGTTASFGAGNYDALSCKYDATGTKQWCKTWGGSSSDEAYAMNVTSDDGYILVGHTTSFGAGGRDALANKYDVDGNLVWSKTWGGANDDFVRSVFQTVEGGYVVGGYEASFGAGNTDTLFAKLSSSGAITGCSGPACQSPSASQNTYAGTVTSPSTAVIYNVTNAIRTSPTTATSSPAGTFTSLY